MRFFLLLWNINKWPTRERFKWAEEHPEDFFAEGNPDASRNWTCHSPEASDGDCVFLLRVSGREEKRGIVLHGKIAGHPFMDNNWDGKLVPHICFVPQSTIHLAAPLISRDRFNKLANRENFQKSGTLLPDEVGKKILREWYLAEQEEKSRQLELDGVMRRAMATRYERDRNFRDACLRRHGYNCAACGFNFNEFYGAELARDFIEVHHIIPVAKMKGAHPINPEKDLIPVCPNCHRMIHRKDPPLEVKALKAIIRQKAAKK